MKKCQNEKQRKVNEAQDILSNSPHVEEELQGRVIGSLFDAGFNHLYMNGVSASRRPPLQVWEMMYGRSRSDAVIAIGSLRPKKNGEFAPHYLCPVLMRGREMVLPGIIEWAQKSDQTLYISPNTLTRRVLVKGDPQLYYDRVRIDGQPLYFPFKNTHVYELVAITVDLDIGRSEDDLTAIQALSFVNNKVSSGVLPQPSMAAYSGRGAYLLWLLREDNSPRPPLFKDETRDLWLLSLEEILRRTTDLKSDKNAKRCANWFKAPGTIDAKTGNEVIYLTYDAGHRSSIQLHTLLSLTSFLGLSNPDIPTNKSGRQRPPSLPNGKPKPRKKPRDRSETSPRENGSDDTKEVNLKGEMCKSRASGPYRARYQDIEKLAEHRGGIFEGLRHFTLLYYFSSVRACYAMTHGPDEAYRKAKARTYEFNRKYCEPPQPDREVKQAVPRKRPKREPRSETITDALEITSDEATVLGLRALVPKALKAERRNAAQQKKALLQQRRDFVDGALRAGKSTSEIIHEAATELHLEVSRAFIHPRKKHLDHRGAKDK